MDERLLLFRIVKKETPVSMYIEYPACRPYRGEYQNYLNGKLKWKPANGNKYIKVQDMDTIHIRNCIKLIQDNRWGAHARSQVSLFWIQIFQLELERRQS